MEKRPLREFDIKVLHLIHIRPRYGYEICVEQSISDVKAVSPSQIYYSLGKLRQLGFIQERTIRGSKAPDRKLYKITPRGSRFLLKGIGELVEKVQDTARTFWEQHRDTIELRERLNSLTRQITSGSLPHTR